MTWEHRGDLRADPGIAPGERNINPPKRRSIWPSIAVVAAAAAFGGVIWFAYQNGRDATRSGPPPLVKADTSPVKVKPDNPGGQDIPFQDSTVYDRLQNSQKPVVEKLLPPTEEPVERPQAPAIAAQSPALPPIAPSVDAAAVPPPPAPVIQAPVIISQPPQAPLTTQSVVISKTSNSAGAAADAGSPTALAPTPGSMVIQPAATARPAAAAAPKPAKAPPTSIAALIDAPGNALPPPKETAGRGYRLQLSAVRSPDAVAPEWARLKHRFPQLAPLKSSSSKIDVAGKGTFYRLEAGPLDEAAAKSTCDKLRTEGLGCIVVKP